jgi:predicted enzyme related to lactoylglutathione lyase
VRRPPGAVDRKAQTTSSSKWLCWLGLDDPERRVGAVHAGSAFGIVEPDLDALGNFYRSVLGWEPLPQGPGYTLLRTPDDGPNGALNEADAPAVTIGVAVDDPDQAVAAAAASGGSVEMPPTDNGWVVKAQVRDPAGNLLTLIAR